MIKRLGRLLLNTATALSLLLCTAALAIWLRATFRSDTAGWAGWRDQPAGIWHGRGVISSSTFQLYYFTGTLCFLDPTNVSGDCATPPPPPHGFHRSGSPNSPGGVKRFRLEKIHLPAGTRFVDLYAIAAPPGVLAAAFAILPLARAATAMAARRRRASRRLTDACLACGYDLRATPEQCPECGATRKSAA